MEALRFPWENDERHREVAPSAFRPRKPRGRGRSQASKPVSRRSANRSRRSSVSYSSAATAAATAAATTMLPRPTVRTVGHASREVASSGGVVQGPQRERHEPDYLLLVAAMALAAIGILMVYSSGGHKAALSGSVFDAIAEQLGWALLGGLVLLAVMRIDYRYWRSFSILGMVIALVLLVLVL
ncbi:MAG: hypothetical protein DRQ55_19710, partial [Planctomycetota bacterium]